MTDEQLFALKRYIDIYVQFCIERAFGRPIPPEYEMRDLEKRFDEIMLGKAQANDPPHA